MTASRTYIQQNRKLSITTPLGEDVLLLRSFGGHEAISQLFRFNLDLVSEASSISFDDIVGQNVTVCIWLADGSERYWNGVISRFSQTGQDDRFTYYRAEMVPWLWFLTRTADCRIFQKKTIPAIVQQIFRESNFLDYSLRLYGDFAEREYCVQYRETDFNFVSRLLEEEGIHYFFEHSREKHELILANPPGGHKPNAVQPTVRYFPVSSGLREDDVISECTIEQNLVPSSWAHADFNFENPTSPLRATLSGPNPFEVYDYPGIFRDVNEGNKVARIRVEEQIMFASVLRGASDCRGFTAGSTFDLTDHYNTALNSCWLLTSVSHSAALGENYQTAAEPPGDESLTYTNTFECIPAAVAYRPPRLTPRPRIDGCQTAVVVGPPGEDIHTDQYGRIKVQFHWDREGKEDDNSSCWIRVSQPWAGRGWGGMFIPHVGQEVIITYEEGDPNRPLVTGRIYNAASMPNIGLPAGKTRSTIGDHGGNQIIMEGDGGKQQIRIGSPKQNTFITIGAANSPEGFNLGSAAHMNRKLGGDDMLSAAGNQLADVIGNVTNTTGGSKSATIAGSRKAAVGGSSMEFVGGSGTSVISGRSSLNVGGSRTEVVAGGHSIMNPKMSINSRSKCTVVAGAKIDEKAPAINVNGTSNVKVKSGGPIKQQAGGPVTVKAGGPIKQQAGGPVNVKAGGPIKQQAGGPINMKAGGPINQQGAAINVKGPTKIKGATKISGNTKINGNTLTVS